MKEVYVAYGENNEVLYVGQGNTGRHKHCLSGTSHNRDLNRYYFNNGEDGSIRVEILHTNLTQDEAIEIEMELINKLKPLFNGIIPNGSAKMLKEKPKFIPYQKTIQEYIVAMQNGVIVKMTTLGKYNELSTFKIRLRMLNKDAQYLYYIFDIENTKEGYFIKFKDVF